MSDEPSVVSEPKRRNAVTAFFIRLWREKPLGMASGIIIVILLLVAIFADVLAPYSYKEMHLIDRLTGPSSQHLLGTDQAGRDLLSRLIIGARVSVLVGLAATAVNVVVAVLVGGISGFLGGRLDLAMQRFVDAWMAFPGLLLLLTVMSIVGRGLPQIIVVLGILGGISGSRVMRSAVIGIKESLLQNSGAQERSRRRQVRTNRLVAFRRRIHRQDICGGSNRPESRAEAASLAVRGQICPVSPCRESADPAIGSWNEVGFSSAGVSTGPPSAPGCRTSGGTSPWRDRGRVSDGRRIRPSDGR